MNHQLTQDSLEKNDFSSTTHSIEVISYDSSLEVPKEYQIPDRYYKDQLVLLPINSSKFYLYWEFTDNLLQKFNLDYASQIKFKVVNSEAKTLKDIDCLGEVGEYFVNNLKYSTNIRVIAGYYNQTGEFVEIMHSNQIGAFNTEINYKDENKLVYLKKEKGFSEIIRSSLQSFTIGMSSAAYVKEIEKLQEFSKLSKDSLSSHSTIGGQ